jgi:ketosteroid isomerase-like protein
MEVDVIATYDEQRTEQRVELTPPPDAFRALAHDFAARLASGDTHGLVDAFYADGARMVPPGSHPITGREAIRRFWQMMIDEGLYEADVEPAGVESAGRAACLVARYSLRGTRPFATSFLESGMCFVLFRRQTDGSWRAVEQTFHSD